MQEVIDPTTESLDLMRRMRGAILQADAEGIEQGFRDAQDLAQAVGALVVASALGWDTEAHEEKAWDLLLRYEPHYVQHERIFSSGYAAGENARAINEFAGELHQAILGGHFSLSHDRLLQEELPLDARSIQLELNQHNVQYAPLSTDLIYAAVMNGLIRHHFGREFQVVPVALDEERTRVVLPASAPIVDPNSAIYTDGDASGRTREAIRTAIQARLDSDRDSRA